MAGMILQFIDRYVGSEYYRGPNQLVLVGVVSLAGLALFKIGFPHGLGGKLQSITVLGFLLALYFLRINPLREKAFILLVIAIFIPPLEFLWYYLQDSESALKYADAGGLYRLMLFLPLAWWLGGRAENGVLIYGLSFVGLIIAVLLDPDLGVSMYNLLHGYRVDFGLKDAQHTGLLFGVAFIGVVVFWKRIITLSGKNKIIGYLSLSILISITMLGLIASQTRAIWLAMTILFLLYIAIASYLSIKRGELKTTAIRLTPLILILLLIISWKYENIENRINKGSTDIVQLFQGDIENIPYSSIGIRIHYWREALERIKERPFTGWGYGVRTRFIKESKVIPERMKESGPQHVHSSYLAILLSHGLIGLGFVIYVFAFLNKKSWEFYKEGKLPGDIFVFGLAFTVFFGVVNFFESYLFIWTGIFLVSIVFAPSYTLSIKEFMQKKYPDKLKNAQQEI